MLLFTPLVCNDEEQWCLQMRDEIVRSGAPVTINVPYMQRQALLGEMNDALQIGNVTPESF